MIPEQSPEQLPSDARCLAIKLGDIGDAVLTLPALEGLRERYPEATIDVLSTPAGAQIYELSPVINTVFQFQKSSLDSLSIGSIGVLATQLPRVLVELRRRRYDAVFLFHHLTTPRGATVYQALLSAIGTPVRAGLDNGRGTFLTHPVPDLGFGHISEWRYAGEIISAVTPIELPESPVELETEPDIHTIPARLVGSRYTIIAPTVGEFGPSRDWGMDRFYDLASRLADDEFGPVVIVGRPASWQLSSMFDSDKRFMNLLNRTSVPQLVELLRHSSLTIAVDGGIAHLSAALERPTLTVFGPSNADAWAPIGAQQMHPEAVVPKSQNLVIRTGIPCSPCFYTGYGLGRPNGCSCRVCLTRISPADVHRIASDLRDNHN